MLDLENKPGALSDVSKKLKAKNINLLYCFGSACAKDCPCRLVLKAEDNDTLVNALR